MLKNLELYFRIVLMIVAIEVHNSSLVAGGCFVQDGDQSTPEITIVSAMYGEGRGGIKCTDEIAKLVLDPETITEVSAAGLGLKSPPAKAKNSVKIWFRLDGQVVRRGDGKEAVLFLKAGRKCNIRTSILDHGRRLTGANFEKLRKQPKSTNRPKEIETKNSQEPNMAASPALSVEKAVSAVELQKFSRTFPTTISSGSEFRFDFKRLIDAEKFELIEGPTGLTISQEGIVQWEVGNELDGTTQELKLKVRQQRDPKDLAYKYSLIVASGEPQTIPGTQQPKPLPIVHGTIPISFPTGFEHEFDFVRLMKAGKFELMEGPGKISNDGIFSWRAGNGDHGKRQKIQFRVTRGAEQVVYVYEFEVLRGPAYIVETKDQPMPISADKANFVWFPNSLNPGRKFQHDMAQTFGEGKYLLLGGLGEISREGLFSWQPNDGNQGIHKLIFQKLDDSLKPTYYYLKLLVADGDRQKFVSSFGKPVATGTLHVEAGEPHTVLECGSPSGWVMSPDGITMIASFADDGQLAYYDTEMEVEKNRVDLDFRPVSLAISGDSLIASGEGSSTVYVLDAQSGKLKKEILINGDAIAHLASHPSKGLVYTSTVKFEVFVVDIRSGTATKTSARGHFLAVDPVYGKYLYTGLQPRDRDELVITVTEKKDRRVIESHFDRWGTRAMILKYEIDKTELKLVDSQNNAAVNGKWMHLTPDGERIMVGGGGGWRPKDDGVGGGSITAIWHTKNLKTRAGQIPSSYYAIFHPVLNFGVWNNTGWLLQPFNSRSFVEEPAMVVNDNGETVGRESLLVFGDKGRKVIVWNGGNFSKRQGLNFVSLKLTEEERSRLAAAYAQ